MSSNYFKKYSGAGNDFIVFDKAENPELPISSEIIRRICDRRYGVGADGIIVINDIPDYNFEMQYYNADGSLGSLCGNGARCALKYASVSGRLPDNKAKFLCNRETYSGVIKTSSEVEFQLHSPQKVKKEFQLKLFDQLIPASFADTGSPHVVVNIDEITSGDKDILNEIDSFPVTKWGKEIRYHEDFAPGGTNVNFVQIKDNVVHIRTFERGVEAETLACGTGSVAASIIAALNYGLTTPVKLKTFGGDYLHVAFDKSGEEFKNVSLTGPAVQVFKGEIKLSN